MLKCNIVNQQGEILSERILLDEVFGIKPNQQVLYDVINQQRAAMRQGTHSTKNRSAVRGGGKKPWSQKGTGHARHGTIRSPLWRGGGVVFGPKPRKYDFKMNAKVRKLALNSALSLQAQKGNLMIIDSLQMNSYKTKEFQQFLNKLQIKNKILLIAKDLNDNLIRSTNNLPKVTLEGVSHVSVYQILAYRHLILTQEAVSYFEEVFKK